MTETVPVPLARDDREQSRATSPLPSQDYDRVAGEARFESSPAATSPMGPLREFPHKTVRPDEPVQIEAWIDSWPIPGQENHPSGWVAGTLVEWHYHPNHGWTGWVRYWLPTAMVEEARRTGVSASKSHLGRFLASRMRQTVESITEGGDDF